MGQAKRRGTYEERRTAAVIKAGVEREEKRRLELERRSRMTEEQRQNERDSAMFLAQALAMCNTFLYKLRL